MAGAKAFVDYVVGTDAQAIIKSYAVAQYGEPLVVADAGKTDAQVLAGQ